MSGPRPSSGLQAHFALCFSFNSGVKIAGCQVSGCTGLKGHFLQCFPCVSSVKIAGGRVFGHKVAHTAIFTVFFKYFLCENRRWPGLRPQSEPKDHFFQCFSYVSDVTIAGCRGSGHPVAQKAIFYSVFHTFSVSKTADCRVSGFKVAQKAIFFSVFHMFSV